jgi:hypothetical protein
MVSSGVPAAVVAAMQMHSSNDEVVEAAFLFLANFSYHKVCCDAFASAGVPGVLVLLSRSARITQSSLYMQTMRNLARSIAGKAAFLSAGAPAAVATLLQMLEPESDAYGEWCDFLRALGVSLDEALGTTAR